VAASCIYIKIEPLDVNCQLQTVASVKMQRVVFLLKLIVFFVASFVCRGGGTDYPRFSLECSLNGYLKEAGECVCAPQWKGPSCNTLKFKPNSGKVVIANPGGAWTWGGSPIYNPADGKFHLFFSYMQNGCGLLHYQTNSVVKHAVAPAPYGPWKILPKPALEPRQLGRFWDSGAIHGPEIHFDKSSKIYLLFYMGTTLEKPKKRPNCYKNSNAKLVDLSSTRRIGLAWSHSIEEGKEEWKRFERPILSPSKPNGWDSSDVSNAAPLVFPNGSVLLAYRGGGDGVALGGGIGLAFSDHWNRSSFRRISDGKMLFAAEDATLWRESSGSSSSLYTYHMLVHRFASKNGSTVGKRVGGHAFSNNGFSAWNYNESQFSYATRVQWINTTFTTLYRRERPKVLFVNETLKYLFNGAWPCHVGPENVDRYDTKVGCQSVTMVAEVGG
jgi:hypothetical protein